MASRFDYVKFDSHAAEKQCKAKEAFIAAEKVVDTLPNGRYKSLALTALEEAYSWVGKAVRDEQIARHPEGAVEEQPERTNA